MLWESIAFFLEPWAERGEALFGGERFAPRATWTDQDGRTIRQPDDAEFTADAIAYYERRADETQNPIHRARYCDIIWERRRDHRFGRAAFDAYLALVPVYLGNDWGIELADAVERLLSLALRLNDPELTRRAVNVHLDTLEVLKSANRHRWFLDLLRSLVASARKVGALVDWDRVAAFGEEAATHFASEGNGLLERQFLEALADIYRQLGQRDVEVKARARIAESFERAAEAQRGSEGGALGAVTLLQSALQLYVDLGMFPERVEAIKGRIKAATIEAGRNMKRVTIPVTIPTEAIERIAKWLEPLPLEKALQELATWKGWIPTYASAKRIAEENAVRFPLSNLATVQVIRNDNPTIQINSDAEKIEYHAVQNIMMTYALFAQVTLPPAFALLATKGLTVDTLRAHLSQSNVFTPERLELVTRGLERYFAGDYVSALHILPIQLEGVIRDIAARLAVPTTSKARGTGLRERQLDDLLAAESLRSAFGEDFVILLTTFLTDQRGSTLRHGVAHALLDPADFQCWLCDLLIMILLHLSSYRLRRHMDEVERDSPAGKAGTSIDHSS